MNNRQLDSFLNVRQNIAIIGNFLPRRCGIATFTTDLLEAILSLAPESQLNAVVMNDTLDGYDYPHQVRFEINDRRLPEYQLAADFLNVTRTDLVCLQHEYGIFGGNNGSHILTFLRNLRMPVITTLHTVLKEPSESQSAVMGEIGRLSDRIVVMSQKAQDILQNVNGITREKIAFIPHGIPDLPFVDPNYFKDQFGVEGHRVILSFGLISPGKGLEYMIEAMPEIVREHQDVVYIILGATHPHVKKEQGESYRLSLQMRVREHGLEKHVIFHNRFVELKELCEFIGAADIYVTPYLNKEQIASGTLAYSLGAGKAVVSTPYWYAQEMLGEGRGRIVPFKDSEALSEQIIDLLDNEVERHAMRKRAYLFCREMIWKEIARRYLELFQEIDKKQLYHPRLSLKKKAPWTTPLELPQIKFSHMFRLTDDVGILQHAKFIVPDRSCGYCTDDNARALIVVLRAQEFVPETEVLLNYACRYLSFLVHAFDDRPRRFRNFMDYERKWMEKEGSEDSHGRAVWSLGVTVALAKKTGLGDIALNIFERAVQPLLDFSSPRAWAFGLIGINAYLTRYSGDSEARRIRERLASRIFDLYKQTATSDWLWLEETVTYDNGKIPQALIMSGDSLKEPEMLKAGLDSLEWLLRIQSNSENLFMPIGNKEWYTKNGEKARFDQQPLEVQSLVETCIEAYKVTKKNKWVAEARRCFEWFLGRNNMNIPLYDYKTGGCCDGLTAEGANLNQGSEATLAWLLSLLDMYSIESFKSLSKNPDNFVQEDPKEEKEHV